MVQNTDDAPVQDAKIVEDETDKNPDALMVARLDEMIKNHISAIAKAKEELASQRQMLKDTFESDPIYMEHAEEAKKAAKVKAKTKAEIAKKPDVAQLADKVKTLGQELRELNSALSDYLSEFQRVSGINEIADETGELRQIVFTAKLSAKLFKGAK